MSDEQAPVPGKYQIPQETFTQVLRAFQTQGVESVWVARCCERIYLGSEKARFCRTCNNTPTNVELKLERGATLDIGPHHIVVP